jgi:GNAT superfamily N-acetyltransferase
MISVRPAAAADVPVLHAMIAELAAYEKIAHEMVATEEDTAREIFGPHPTAEAMIAEVDGVAVGFSVFYPVYSTFAGRPGLYLEDLYVRPAHRRSGVGRALITAFLDIAKSRRCPKVEWRVLRWNTPALEFYRSLGAVVLDDWVPVRALLE